MSKEKIKDKCWKCGNCCKYVAVEIDKPKTKKDFEDIKWYVCHKNVNVFVDENNIWYVEFLTKCEFLDENNLCKIYNKRPKICKKYNPDECIKNGQGSGEKLKFSHLEQIEKYIQKKFN